MFPEWPDRLSERDIKKGEPVVVFNGWFSSQYIKPIFHIVPV